MSTTYEPFVRHRRCDPDGSDIHLQTYGRNNFPNSESRTYQGPSPPETTHIHYTDNIGQVYPADGRQSHSPLAQVKDLERRLYQEPQYRTSVYRSSGGSPKNNVTPNSSSEQLQESPKNSKRIPIIPIQAEDRLFLSVDVSKYQLKPDRLSYPYGEMSQHSPGSTSGGSNVYARIPAV